MDKSNLKLCVYRNEDFQTILNHGYGTVPVENGTFRTVDHRGYNTILFEDMLFEQDYDLRLGGTSLPISFNNCYFEKRVLFNFVAVHNNRLRFENCIADNELYFQGNLGNIKFDKCSDLKNVIINTESTIKSIEISDSSFDTFIISSLQIQGELKITSTTISKTLSVKSIVNDVSISGGEYSEINFINAKFLKTIFIGEHSKIKKINFSHCLFKADITIDSCTIGQIINNTPNKPYCISIYNSEIEKFKIDLDEIELADISHLKGNSSLFLENRLLEGRSFFVHVSSLASFYLENVKIDGQMELSSIDIKKGGILSFCDSNLGKTKILNCKFDKSEFWFVNNQISEIFIADTDFPRKVLGGNSIANKVQARLAFGQLQKVFEGQGDSIRHYEYQSREVESYYKAITLFHLRFPWINFSKVNLFLNCISNNFGRYWAQGIVFTICVAFLFFNLTINSTNRYDFSFHFNKDMVGSFFKFINPVRHFEIETLFKSGEGVTSLGVNPMTYVWDFLGRIFVAYGYYQTIQAFRRFGRK